MSTLSARIAMTLLSVLFAVGIASSAVPASGAELSPNMKLAEQVSARALARTTAITPTDKYPHYTVGDRTWGFGRTTGWINGFLPGSLWYEYQRTGDPALRRAAEKREATFATKASSDGTHDIGFMLMTSYGNSYRLTNSASSRAILLQGASSLSRRYNPKVGMIRTNNTSGDFRVYNDTMMNLELLFWGARNGGDHRMRAMATSHALRSAKDFLRPDGSTYHYVAYNEITGAVRAKGQGQGYADESTWSRGHAWTIHGMSTAYRETGDARFLAAAWKLTEYWTANVPADLVPYWDFNAPKVPYEPRDSSAAAVAADAFVELAQLEPDTAKRAVYGDLATRTLESLSSPEYLSDDPLFPAVLKHGTYGAMAGSSDTGTSWGDYYFREALMRYRTSVQRVGGPDRFQTAVRASYTEFQEATTAVLASGETFPDALAASSLAGIYDAPILLTERTRLPSSVKAELTRLGASEVVIVGGESSVGSGVESALRSLPGVHVTRVSGSNRAATAVAVSKRVTAETSTRTPVVFLACENGFADAVAASPIAYARKYPLLLTASSSLSDATERELRRLAPATVVVLGGENSVSANVLGRIASVSGGDVIRIAGGDRHETSVALAKWADTAGLIDTESHGVASGAGFADALGAGSAIGHRRGLLLLTPSGSLASSAADWLAARATVNTLVTVYGAPAVISGRVENDIRNALPEQ